MIMIINSLELKSYEEGLKEHIYKLEKNGFFRESNCLQTFKEL